MLVMAPIAVAVAFAAWSASAAVSLRPYIPRPVDFELRQPGTAAEALASGGRRTVLRSGVVVAPKRFNLVGLRWRGARNAKLLLRVRRDGGRWQRWTKVPVDSDDAPDRGSDEERSLSVSDPVWVGEADQLQYRLSGHGRFRALTLHFVNSKGTATALDRLRSRVGRAVSGAVSAVVSIFGGDARAQTGEPVIISRDQWGASACPPRANPQYGEVKLAFIHHTVTTNDYGPGDSAAIVLGICRYHRNSNGWNDIGYQFLVDKYGQVFEGRAGGVDKAVVGAQAQGYNDQSTGIASIGTFSTVGQTDAGLSALARLLSWKLAIHGVPPQGKVLVRSGGGPLNRYPAGATVELDTISGHRDADATACPGDGLYSQLPRLRAMVAPDPRAATTLALRSLRGRIPYGRKARFEGSLRGGDGSPQTTQRVRITAFSPVGTARTVDELATDPHGSFHAAIRLPFNRTLQAAFAGSSVLRPSISARVPIGVRPRVTAKLASIAGTLRSGQRVLVTGNVRPRKRFVLLIVDRRKPSGSYGRVAKLKTRAQRGLVRVRYRFARTGAYRLRLGVDADARNLSARSDPILLTVR
jgi:N-acetylmuramoyl-L-alanine amidase